MKDSHFLAMLAGAMCFAVIGLAVQGNWVAAAVAGVAGAVSASLARAEAAREAGHG